MYFVSQSGLKRCICKECILVVLGTWVHSCVRQGVEPDAGEALLGHGYTSFHTVGAVLSPDGTDYKVNSQWIRSTR